MEFLVKLYDEIDDVIGPVFAMAGIADVLCGAGLIASIAAGLALGSLKLAVAGCVLSGLVVAAREWWPAPTGSRAPDVLTPVRQTR